MPNPPDGLPVVDFARLLQMAGLASAATLRKDRLQPDPDKVPAGCYWSGHAWVLLHEVAGAVPMPPLSPGRQRAYDRVRTCATCGRRSKRPWYLGPDGRTRYCADCLELAWQRLWEQQQASRRAAATEWAREVLADPATVLFTANRLGWCVTLRAETIAGDVLLDLLVRQCTHDPCDHDAQAVPAGAVASADADPVVAAALAGRRLVTWRDLGWLRYLPALRQREAAVYGTHWSGWVGERRVSTCALGDDAPYELYHDLVDQWRPDDAAQEIPAMRAGLAEMAAGHGRVACEDCGSYHA